VVWVRAKHGKSIIKGFKKWGFASKRKDVGSSFSEQQVKIFLKYALKSKNNKIYLLL